MNCEKHFFHVLILTKIYKIVNILEIRARLATRGGRILSSVCICRWAGRTCLFSAIFKN